MGQDSLGEKEQRLNQLYLAIISRYKDYIEDQEGLSVAELPTLVTPNADRVREKVEDIKSSFLNYNYDENFYEASVIAYEFVKNGVEEVTLPLQFWLTPEETFEFMMGDIMDKNILLCSMLVRLGNPSAKVFVKMFESTREVFVYYEYKNSLYSFYKDKVSEFPSKDAMLNTLDFKDETIAYEFNNQMYADLY
ncbi:MAG: hypothetical protein ABR981_05120 [Candidatus Micrarchaeaceae archaeon]|jgi:hypothetical protein